MSIFRKIVTAVATAMAAFFAVTFTIYFFNLDMKLTASLEPFFLKHYDKIKRDRHL